MANSITPHTESQQNRQPERSDLEPDQREQTAGTGTDADTYRNRQGAQTGTNRAPERMPDAAPHHDVEPNAAAEEGTLTNRAPGGSGQGISSRSLDEEQPGQRKVVSQRPDAQAGVNHNRT